MSLLPSPLKSSGNPVAVRKARSSDTSQIADLIIRLKKLNNEFDPLFGVADDALEKAVKYVELSLSDGKTLLMVAAIGGKVIGVVRAEKRERLFYNPSNEGHITDLYVLPEHRQKRLGELMLDKTMDELAKMGADIFVAELPTRNEIGVSFYSRRGFRRLAETFARMPQ